MSQLVSSQLHFPSLLSSSWLRFVSLLTPALSLTARLRLQFGRPALRLQFGAPRSVSNSAPRAPSLTSCANEILRAIERTYTSSPNRLATVAWDGGESSSKLRISMRDSRSTCASTLLTPSSYPNYSLSLHTFSLNPSSTHHHSHLSCSCSNSTVWF